MVKNKISDYRTTFRVIKPDQEPLHIMSIGRFTYDENGNPILSTGLVWDITDLKAAEQAIRDSQEQMRTLVDSICSVIFMKDTEGRHLLVNTFYEEATGISRETVIGKTDLEVMPQEVAEAIMTQDRVVMDSREALTYEENVPATDGSLRSYLTTKVPLINAAGKVYGMCGIATDITDMKAAEKELQERMADLERFSRLTVNREEKMIQLKVEINSLLEQLDQPPKYKIVE